jgi:hypothetical protein
MADILIKTDDDGGQFFQRDNEFYYLKDGKKFTYTDMEPGAKEIRKKGMLDAIADPNVGSLASGFKYGDSGQIVSVPQSEGSELDASKTGLDSELDASKVTLDFFGDPIESKTPLTAEQKEQSIARLEKSAELAGDLDTKTRPRTMIGNLAKGFENVLESDSGKKALAQAFDFGVKGAGPAVLATAAGLTAEGFARFGPGGSQEIATKELEDIAQREQEIGLVGREEERDIKASAGRAGAALQQEIEQTAAATGRLDPRQIQAAAEQAKKIEEQGVVKGKAVRAAMQSQEEQQLDLAKRAFQAQQIANREAFAGSIGRAMTGLAQLSGQYAGSLRGISINRGDTASLLKKYGVSDDIINDIGLVDQKGLEQIVFDAAGDLSTKNKQEILKQFRADLGRL